MRPMFSFSSSVLAPLRDAVLPKPCLVALCGPAGCGKLAALRQAVGPVCVYDVEKESTASEVRAIYKWLQPQLGQSGKCVWAIKPAELLTKCAVAEMKRLWDKDPCGVRIVLISCEKVHHVPIVYMPQVDRKQLTQWVLDQGGEPDLVAAAGRDLRQLGILLAQSAMCSTTDKQRHPYFDTAAILRGVKRPLEAYNPAWLEANSQGESIEGMVPLLRCRCVRRHPAGR